MKERERVSEGEVREREPSDGCLCVCSPLAYQSPHLPITFVHRLFLPLPLPDTVPVSLHPCRDSLPCAHVLCGVGQSLISTDNKASASRL